MWFFAADDEGASGTFIKQGQVSELSLRGDMKNGR
jgi:hypothetical protein